VESLYGQVRLGLFVYLASIERDNLPSNFHISHEGSLVSTTPPSLSRAQAAWVRLVQPRLPSSQSPVFPPSPPSGPGRGQRAPRQRLPPAALAPPPAGAVLDAPGGGSRRYRHCGTARLCQWWAPWEVIGRATGACYLISVGCDHCCVWLPADAHTLLPAVQRRSGSGLSTPGTSTTCHARTTACSGGRPLCCGCCQSRSMCVAAAACLRRVLPLACHPWYACTGIPGNCTVFCRPRLLAAPTCCPID